MNNNLIEQNKHLFAQNQALLEQVRQLTEQIQYLNKKLFGSSSEKTKVAEGQISLFDPESFFEETETTEDQTVEEITYRRKKQKGRKAELIKDLPVKEIHCQLHGDDCPM